MAKVESANLQSPDEENPHNVDLESANAIIAGEDILSEEDLRGEDAEEMIFENQLEVEGSVDSAATDLQDDKNEVEKPALAKEESQWMKIRKWACRCLFLSLLTLGIIIAVDIILFYKANSKFDTDSVNFYLESGNSDAKCIVRGNYPTHSTFSAYDLVHPKCVVGYSNAGRSSSDLHYLSTVGISAQRVGSASSSSTGFAGLGAVYNEPIKITIDLKNTEYGNFNLFLQDVLNIDTKNSFVHVDCQTDLEIKFLDYFPVVARDIKVSRWFPLHLHRSHTSRNSTQRSKKSTTTKADSEWELPKAITRQELPTLSVLSSSSSKLEVGIDWDIKNFIRFAKSAPSVFIHVPKISYSVSTIGSDDVRWNADTSPLQFELTHSHFHLETNFTLETRDRNSLETKLPLASSDALFNFLERFSEQRVDIVWDAETDNFFTRLLGLNHHVGISNVTANDPTPDYDDCRGVTMKYNGNTTFDAVGCRIHDPTETDERWRMTILDGDIDLNDVRSLNTSTFMKERSLLSGEVTISSQISDNADEMKATTVFRMRNGAEGSLGVVWSNEKGIGNGMNTSTSFFMLLDTKGFPQFEVNSHSHTYMEDNSLWFDSETSWLLNNISDSFHADIELHGNDTMIQGDLNCEIELDSIGSVYLLGDYNFLDTHEW